MRISIFMTLVLLLTGGLFVSKDPPDEPLRSTYERDADGDGKPDKLVYEIKRVEDHYEGSLFITSAAGKILWGHEWGMSESDLLELVQTEGDVTNKKVNMEMWVKKFLIGELNYGARFEKRKLKASELGADENLAPYAEHFHVSVASMKQTILSQKVNLLFSYRAVWREDLLLLVYVPSIGQFVCYQRGY